MKKNKLCVKVIATILFIIMMSINVVYANPETIKVIYIYDEEKNQVITQIISNVELKDTKPTWELSEDKKIYSKIFSENKEYVTQVEDIDGNIIDANINVTQVKIAQINIEYEYNEENNTVLAKLISNIELQDTKPTWELSEDKKVYTKVFTVNSNYTTTVTDIFGNIIDADINVTQVKIAQIKMEYDYDDKNNIVIAKMISDIELQDTKPSWKLSEDKLIYTKTFAENTAYSTEAVDQGGNIINVDICINQIDDKAPEINLEYKYNDDNTVTINLKSNERLGNTKPTWILSEDGLIYSKTFNTKQDYTTDIQDIYGNTITLPIKLKNKQEIFPQEDGSTILVRYMYTSYEHVIVQIVSSVPMENTKPTWDLSEDGYTYTKLYGKNENYSTEIKDINGKEKEVKIEINYYLPIIIESGSYGASGAKVHGIPGGSNLEYYRFGNGENVLFTTFCLHGFEDAWDRDGEVLVEIANNFYNRLVSDYDQDLAKKWTIYICKEVNPDGRRLGTTKDGPGRTTIYSRAKKGIDLNRCWQTDSEYKIYTNTRNYNGTKGFQAYEAEYLRDFLLANKSKTGQTILVDLHGWLDQLIGDEEICKYYQEQYSLNKLSYGRYGTQYLITWARQNLGAKVALVELPAEVNEYADVYDMKLSDKYIDATLNMLKGI